MPSAKWGSTYCTALQEKYNTTMAWLVFRVDREEKAHLFEERVQHQRNTETEQELARTKVVERKPNRNFGATSPRLHRSCARAERPGKYQGRIGANKFGIAAAGEHAGAE
jgi:hypothetical protein